MKFARILLVLLLAAVSGATRAGETDDDWKLFGGILSLVQSFVRIAATTDDPVAMQKGIDVMLSGRNPQANRLGAELMNELLEDMPAQYRGTVSALAHDVLTIARREHARSLAAGGPADAERSLNARKELHAMGLRYYDQAQYREAVRRRDTLAVELFHAGRGIKVEPAAN